MTDTALTRSNEVTAVLFDASRERDGQYVDLAQQLDSADATRVFVLLRRPDDAIYFGADRRMELLALSAEERERAERFELRWEYWNGDSWASLRVTDRWVTPEADSDVAEVRQVSWSQPDDWRPRSIGDAGLQIRDRYWIRSQLVAAPAVVIPWWRSCSSLIGIGAVITLIFGAVLVFTLFGDGDDEADLGTGEPTMVATGTSAASPTGPAASPTEATALPETVTPTVESQPADDLSGRWLLEFVETVALGVCAPEVGERFEWELVFEHAGTSVRISGIGDDSSQAWVGTLEGSNLIFSGSYPEDGGVTTATFDLAVSFEEMTAEGGKYWEWVGAAGTCPDGESDVTAIRIAGT